MLQPYGRTQDASNMDHPSRQLLDFIFSDLELLSAARSLHILDTPNVILQCFAFDSWFAQGTNELLLTDLV